jgi:hypothetical protein
LEGKKIVKKRKEKEKREREREREKEIESRTRKEKHKKRIKNHRKRNWIVFNTSYIISIFPLKHYWTTVFGLQAVRNAPRNVWRTSLEAT